jgi:AcrR family transcriptional regulator
LPNVAHRPKDRNPSRWAGLSPADRRAERRELLLDVAFELLGTEGWAGTSVRAVCQAARLNPRYFYESFEDLDQLVVAVYDRLVAQLGAEVMAAVAASGTDPRAGTRAAIDCIVRFVDEDRRRARVLYVEALGNEALNGRRIETAHQLVSVVELAGAERYGGLPPGEHVGRLGAAILVGGAGELVVAWLDGRIDVGREQLVDDATEILLAVGEAVARLAARRT